VQIRSKWIMQEHFKHLRFKTFLMVSQGSNLVFVYLSNQGFQHSWLFHECNSQSGSALRSSLGSIPCTFRHLWKCVSHLNTFFWPHGPLHFTFSHEPNVKVATSSLTFALYLFMQGFMVKYIVSYKVVIISSASNNNEYHYD
jgi:hypothetical protein